MRNGIRIAYDRDDRIRIDTHDTHACVTRACVIDECAKRGTRCLHQVASWSSAEWNSSSSERNDAETGKLARSVIIYSYSEICENHVLYIEEDAGEIEVTKRVAKRISMVYIELYIEPPTKLFQEKDAKLVSTIYFLIKNVEMFFDIAI